MSNTDHPDNDIKNAQKYAAYLLGTVSAMYDAALQLNDAVKARTECRDDAASEIEDLYREIDEVGGKFKSLQLWDDEDHSELYLYEDQI